MFLSKEEVVDMILIETAKGCGFSVEVVKSCLTEIIERAIKEDDIIFKEWQKELGELTLEKVIFKLAEIITNNKNLYL